MEDRRLMWSALLISLLIHILLGVMTLVITVMVRQEIPEFIEMSYGQWQPIETKARMVKPQTPPTTTLPQPTAEPPIVKPSPQRPVEKQATQTKPAPQTPARQPQTQPATPQTQPATTPVKVAPPVAEAKPDEKIVMPTKKFSAQDRFKNQDNKLTDTSGLLTGDKTAGTVSDQIPTLSDTKPSPTIQTDKEAGDLFTTTDAGSTKETFGIPTAGPERPGAFVPSGSTLDPVEIISDTKGRMPVEQPFPSRVEGLSKDTTIEVAFLVKPDGSVYAIRPIKKGDPVLEQVSLEYLKKWVFPPDFSTDEPLEVRVRVTSQLQ